MKAIGLKSFRIGVVILVFLAFHHQSQSARLYDGCFLPVASSSVIFDKTLSPEQMTIRFATILRHKVLRVIPQNEDQVRSLRELLQRKNDVDVWKDSLIPGEEVHIDLGPDAIKDFKAYLSERSLEFDTMIEDTQTLIDNEEVCCSEVNEDNFDKCYHTLDEDCPGLLEGDSASGLWDQDTYNRDESIYNELFRLAEEYPHLVKLINLGKSYEQRNMLGIEIKQKKHLSHERRLVFIICGIHAREWISPATCMYILRQLLESKDGNDEGAANMLNTFDWFFLPVVNVDGYNYTQEVDRLWRKNRRPVLSVGSVNIIGVDLNRNFPNENWDPVYGGTIDYVYDTLGVTHSYTMELRPPANFSGKGFILPACQITESGREIMAAFKALITPLMAETVDVWKESLIPGEEFHIHLSPDAIEDFKADLTKRSLEFEIMIDDIQALIDKESLCCAERDEDNFDNCYHTVDEIHDELFRLGKEYPDLVKLINLGKSYEKRNMLGIQIKQKIHNARERGLVFIVCGIHAREWISPATCMYMLRQLLKSTESDEGIANMLNTFNWFFLPVYNVDGYNFTMEVDRLWRKNRRPILFTSSGPIVGVDLNRNFPNEYWGLNDCISDPICETYPGEEPLSEIETRNVVAHLKRSAPQLISFFDLHSYSQVWCSPWSSKNGTPPDYSLMRRVMKVGTEAIRNTSGRVFEFGTIYSTIYPAYGDTVDYTYDGLGVTHSYTIELRPSESADNGDESGFILPACQIIDSGREIMAAFKAITPVMAKSERKVKRKRKRTSQHST
ncbi:unnamed protein product [Porites lobata]|uniref:Peptidase M14 domain-containing protein n=1 Tax=Porites lobata TaxID=104759 RepID=A0ABN8PEM2_9CNID|nr:unnamed protein product [Porites lobata]